MADALLVDGLTKDYSVGFWRPRPYRALDALSLTVTQGEVYGFLGPNGAGKTTTLKLLMDLVAPSAGRIEILGHAPGSLALKRRIGFLPENPYFYDHLTAEELLRYFAGLFGYRGADATRRVASLLDVVKLGAERRLALRKFSKGMIQRVGIAQALLNDPEMVFLDEPMSGLDPLGRRDVRELILRLRNEGRTVFFSSHILSDAEALCSRVGIVAKGRLVASGAVSDLVAFGVKGWEAVVEGLDATARERLVPAPYAWHNIAADRCTLDFGVDVTPPMIVAGIAAAGGRLVSLMPIRDTLEDFFVSHVNAATWDRFTPSADARPS